MLQPRTKINAALVLLYNLDFVMTQANRLKIKNVLKHDNL
jgi:hypothetical protein